MIFKPESHLCVISRVIKFTEVADIASVADPISGTTIEVRNYRDYLLTNKQFNECTVYTLTGSVLKQINLSNEVPVSDLDSGMF